MLTGLDQEERMQLMKFVCSFAWADLEVQEEERQFVAKVMKALDLSEEERSQVHTWLEEGPPEVDPTEVPRAHRALFVDTVRAVVVSDAIIDPGERESLELFEQLLR